MQREAPQGARVDIALQAPQHTYYGGIDDKKVFVKIS